MKAVFLFLACCASACGFAVDSFDYHCANIALLQDKRVQAEVGVTDQQRAKMNQAADQNRAQMKAYQEKLKGGKPDMKVVAGYLEQLKQQVVGQLSAAQVKRLRELNLQAAGLLGLLDKVVATKVGMSSAQIEKYKNTYVSGKSAADKIVRSVEMPIIQKYQKLAQAYKGKERDHQPELKKLAQDFEQESRSAQLKVKPQVTSIEKNTEKNLLAILTPKQKAAWDALKGRKFTPK